MYVIRSEMYEIYCLNIYYLNNTVYTNYVVFII